MGFDADSDGRPIVNVHKKTTQVNLWMVVGVAVFFIVGAAILTFVDVARGRAAARAAEAELRPVS